MMGTELRAPQNLHVGTQHGLFCNIRSVKMLRPLCTSDKETGFVGCQSAPGARQSNSGWVRDCLAKGHDPYHQMRRGVETHPVLTEVEPGRFRETGQERFITYSERPNIAQVQLQAQASGTYLGMDPVTWKRTHGFILPEEHPTKPYVTFCQYYQCWSQDIAVRDRAFGNYCTEEGARLIVLATRGRALQINDREKRQEQLETIRVGA